LVLDGGSDVILFDKILMGVVLMSAGTLCFLVYRWARKDPDLWIWGTIKYWNIMEKFQPEESKGLLSRRKKREKDQRRE